MLYLLLILCLNYLCSAKEIIATKEWRKVEEGESIPKGLHVKMNFETGEKWVKLLDEKDEENDDVGTMIFSVNEPAASDESKISGVKITQLEHGQISAETAAKIQEQLLKEAQRKKNVIESITKLNDFKSDQSLKEQDYETMYRTLLGLPDDERALIEDFPLKPLDGASPEALTIFEESIRKIWASRQALLKQMEEEYLADVTDIIQDRISSLTEYVTNPSEGIKKVLKRQLDNESEIGDDDLNIVESLQDLEFQLTDLDNARDFYKMGGWPLLVSLLTDSIHGLGYVLEEELRLTNNTDTNGRFRLSKEQMEYLEQYQKVSWKIQGLAAWSIGTAVKNTEEFHSWALDDFSDLLQNQSDDKNDNVNVITILLGKLEGGANQSPSIIEISPNDTVYQAKRKYELYALGSLVRGNRKALATFTAAGGPAVLYNLYRTISLPLLSESADLDRNTIAIATKIMSICDDLIMDVTLNPIDDEALRRLDESLLIELTSPHWCKAPIEMMGIPSILVQRKILDTMIRMGSYCKYDRNVIDEIKSKLLRSSDSLADDEIKNTLEKLEQIES